MARDPGLYLEHLRLCVARQWASFRCHCKADLIKPRPGAIADGSCGFRVADRVWPCCDRKMEQTHGDATIAFLSDGYRFGLNRFERFGTDVFQTRLGGLPMTFLRGDRKSVVQGQGVIAGR